MTTLMNKDDLDGIDFSNPSVVRSFFARLWADRDVVRLHKTSEIFASALPRLCATGTRETQVAVVASVAELARRAVAELSVTATSRGGAPTGDEEEGEVHEDDIWGYRQEPVSLPQWDAFSKEAARCLGRVLAPAFTSMPFARIVVHDVQEVETSTADSKTEPKMDAENAAAASVPDSYLALLALTNSTILPHLPALGAAASGDPAYQINLISFLSTACTLSLLVRAAASTLGLAAAPNEATIQSQVGPTDKSQGLAHALEVSIIKACGGP
ncbi:hypothetical protein M427DRAFT_62405 [Gonapodya prolifera JEL478]|uniref:Uncharacterized protein n=1 Tax=Gonapodya prolifera (strain JEL478) TaxID=1344416 RepID=A0A139A0X7_GONPJ|nr:hypothetical protein M427DRAFT_62405 [Gonapodya prolifera JEL478]|eukprot:KXS10429.1 hypothetical protein M427DRAFT_62405 [Gonapodya prolifera JEL478]